MTGHDYIKQLMTEKNMDQKQIAVVTGGNKGLGFETCRQLMERGLYVVVTAREQAKAKKAAETLDPSASSVTWAVLDVTDAASIAAFAGQVKKNWGRVDVLVNNAGIAIYGTLDEASARATVDTNFFGPLRVTDALVPSLHKGSRIVMVSSVMGQLSCLSGALRDQFESPALSREQLIDLMQDFVRSAGDNTAARRGWPASAYSVSKVGLNMLTRILSKELAPRGIAVNAVHPGWVRTDMGGPSAPLDTTTGAQSIVWAAVISGNVPTGCFFHDGRTMRW